MRIFVRTQVRTGLEFVVGLAIVATFLAPVALAQKPPAPAPPVSPPPVATPGRTTNPLSVNSQPETLAGDLVMYLEGSVVTDDGAPLPDNVMVERVCNSGVRQQVYATVRGNFSMELGTMADPVLDASADGNLRNGPSLKNGGQGIPRRDLLSCEMRASVSGFTSKTVPLTDMTPSDRNVNVGSIVVHRTAKVKGMVLNAAAYKAPGNARRAYEKGLESSQKGKLADARQHFEEAVKIYPRYTNAWFELGDVLQKQTEKDAARKAYLRATEIDSKFLPPFLGLASMAFEAQEWKEVLGLTSQILRNDSLDYGKVTGSLLDLDSDDYSRAYFYNAAANFRLNRIAEAEKSGLQAERLDLWPHYPQLRLLLAKIFASESKYANAIDQLQMYLTIVPQGRSADRAREQLAQLEKLKVAGPVGEKTDQN
jgi:tetratricopeptide (TPR) repeat protein